MKLTITEMKRRNKKAGFNWLSKGTRIETEPNVENIFITSEWADFNETERKYTLRWFNAITNNVKTLGEFLQYETLDDAEKGREEFSRVKREMGFIG